MTYNVLMGTLNHTHSLTHVIVCFIDQQSLRRYDVSLAQNILRVWPTREFHYGNVCTLHYATVASARFYAVRLCRRTK